MLVLFGAGLRAPAAPGSIIAVYIQTASGSFLGVTVSVLAAATVSFLIASVILRASKEKGEGDLAAATAEMEAMKGKKSAVGGLIGVAEQAETEAAGTTPGHVTGADTVVDPGFGGTTTTKPITSIVFACDAGMGSSAMGASVLRNKIKKAGFTDVSVVNVAIANLEDNVDLIVTHQDLTDRARLKAPHAQHVSVDNFMSSPKYDEVVNSVRTTHGQ
jgi:mannitol PTS system EIICBA or EIICB component